jgi:hypothetical protein
MLEDHVTPDRVRDSFNWYGLLKVMDSIILTTNSDHPPAFEDRSKSHRSNVEWNKPNGKDL